MPETFLVTGAGGFLGGAVARQLLARGDRVKSVSRGDYPHLKAAGIEHVRADLADPKAVADVVAGVDAVFHVAAKAGIWGPRDEFVKANVIATENVIAACRSADVKRLIFTSSPSVVFAADHQENVDETAPYPTQFLNFYTETKAQAERAVRAANGADLLTVSLRPHLIVGDGDPHLIPRLIARGRQKKLMVVGGGENLADMTWVEDAARAHLLAADKLRDDGANAACAGQVYFITQGEPVALWPWIEDVFARLGVPKISRRISYPFARRVGATLEFAYKLFGLAGEPRMTRFLAAQLAKSHTYSIANARRDLGYEPTLTMAAVTDKLVEWIRANEI